MSDDGPRTPLQRLVARPALLVIAVLAPVLAACSQTEPVDSEGPPAAASKVPSARAPEASATPLLMPAAFDCFPVRNDETAGIDQFPVPKPPFTKDIFPCTRCHDKPDDFNAKPRNLVAVHTDIQLVHGSREQWCYDCHNPSNRDMLRLAGGRLVSFETSYELCGQCHGEKLRDWRAGIHGRRTGCWNGKRMYLLCVNCHNPHSPRFKGLHPMPQPKRPTEIHLDQGSES